MGRPSTFTQEIADEICERLSKGEPLAAICRDEAMPHPTTFRRWCEGNEPLAIAYAHARDDGFDAIALQGLNIVDDVDEDPASRRVRADYRLKLLAKWDPKRYGDKTLVGSDPENPLPSGFAVTYVNPPAETD